MGIRERGGVIMPRGSAWPRAVVASVGIASLCVLGAVLGTTDVIIGMIILLVILWFID